MLLSIPQIRAARSLLGLSQSDLAERVNLSVTALTQIERGRSTPRTQTLKNIKQALEDAGVEFLPQSGVRMRINTFITMEGPRCLPFLHNDVFETLSAAGGGELCVIGVSDKSYAKEDEKTMFTYMRKAYQAGVRERAIVEEGDNFLLFPPEFTTYRCIPKRFFHSQPFYAYKNKVAFLIWGDATKLVLIEDKNLYEASMKIFEMMWSTTSEPARIEPVFKL